MWWKLSRLILLIIVCSFALNFVKTFRNFQHKKAKIEVEKQHLDRLKQDNANLKKELIRVNSRNFIEEEARNKLNLCYPDETVVVIPQSSF